MRRQQALQAAIVVTLVMLFLTGCGSPEPTPVAETQAPDYAPLAAGSTWDYQLTIPSAVRVPMAPYFIEPDGMMASSITNGMLEREGGSWSVSIRVVEAISPDAARIEVSPELLSLWFNLELAETRIAIRRSSTYGVLEIQGVTKKEEPWILGMPVASFLFDEAEPVELNGFLVEAGTAPLIVGTREFSRTIHSRETRGDGQYAANHIVDSWLADGVGLVKLLVSSVEGEPIYGLELTGYTAGK